MFLVKMAGYGWLPCSFFCFSVFMDLDFVLVHKNTKKELCQYPTLLTSPLVNNAYTSCISLKYKCSLETVKNKIPFPHWPFLFYTH